MTEAEWLACADPEPMLEFMRGKASDRKLRLVTLACCHRIDRLITHPAAREAVEFAERYVEQGVVRRKGRAGVEAAAEKALRAAYRQAHSAADDEGRNKFFLVAHALNAAARTVFTDSRFAASHATIYSAFAAAHDAHLAAEIDSAWESYLPAEKAHQARLLRDVFGNPFRPVTLSPSYRTPTIASLARAAYDERHLPSGELDLQRLAVLADALEEAGAADELVAHLRSPGPHVRGCWAVDLCLCLG